MTPDENDNSSESLASLSIPYEDVRILESTVIKLIDTSMRSTNTVNSPLKDIYIMQRLNYSLHSSNKPAYLDCCTIVPNCKSRKRCCPRIFHQCGSPLKLYVIFHGSHQYILANPIESISKSIKSGNMRIAKCPHCINN